MSEKLHNIITTAQYSSRNCIVDINVHYMMDIFIYLTIYQLVITTKTAVPDISSPIDFYCCRPTVDILNGKQWI